MAELLCILLIASTVIIFSLVSQFFAHPVISNLTDEKWLRTFAGVERHPWLSLVGLFWILVHIWCLF